MDLHFDQNIYFLSESIKQNEAIKMKTEPYCEFMATHEKIDTDDPESNSDEAIAVEFQLVRSVQRGDYHSVCNILSTISERDSVSEKSLKESLDISVSLRNREITNRLLKFASQILKQQRSGQIQDVWPAYQETSEWTPIFVVMSYVWYPEDQYLGYRILWRKNDDVSSEGSIVANSAEVRENPLSYDEMIFMKKLIRTANLFKYHKNITVVNACPCKSRNGGKDISLEKCIVIYTHVKGLIPFDEQPFPKNIDGVPVDVREAYVKLGMYGGKVRTSYGRRVCHRENDADNESCSIPTCEASAVLIAADISMDNLSVDILSSSHILDTNKQNKDSGSQLLPDIDTQMFMDGMCSINIPETSPSLSNTPSVASMSDTSAVQPSGMRELPLSMREISLEQGMNTKGYYFPQTNVHKKRKFRHEYVYPMGPASPDQSQYMQHLELSAATAMEISSTVDEYSTNCTDTKTKAVSLVDIL